MMIIIIVSQSTQFSYDQLHRDSSIKYDETALS